MLARRLLEYHPTGVPVFQKQFKYTLACPTRAGELAEHPMLASSIPMNALPVPMLTQVFGVPYGLRKWTHLGPYKIVAYLGSGPRNTNFTM